MEELVVVAVVCAFGALVACLAMIRALEEVCRNAQRDLSRLEDRVEALEKQRNP
ncbi:MAG: hypothetical protein U0638_01770 [Phycisphaerales bacterium]